jgi:protein phosphatase
MMMAEFTWISAARTDTGLVREANEDNYYENRQLGVWVVADGMGGHARGAEASQAIVESLANIETFKNLDALEKIIHQKLQKAHQQLRDRAVEKGEEIIGSTVAALLLFEDSFSCIWAGDSRIYLSRLGELNQLTRDHTQANEFVELGLLEPGQAMEHPSGHLLTRAVGGDVVLELETVRHQLHDNDMFLLCSDGLVNEVSSTEIATELIRGDCAKACDNLLNLVLERGAPDNVTLIVVRADKPQVNDETMLNPALVLD